MQIQVTWWNILFFIILIVFTYYQGVVKQFLLFTAILFFFREILHQILERIYPKRDKAARRVKKVVRRQVVRDNEKKTYQKHLRNRVGQASQQSKGVIAPVVDTKCSEISRESQKADEIKQQPVEDSGRGKKKPVDGYEGFLRELMSGDSEEIISKLKNGEIESYLLKQHNYRLVPLITKIKYAEIHDKTKLLLLRKLLIEKMLPKKIEIMLDHFMRISRATSGKYEKKINLPDILSKQAEKPFILVSGAYIYSLNDIKELLEKDPDTVLYHLDNLHFTPWLRDFISEEIADIFEDIGNSDKEGYKKLADLKRLLGYKSTGMRKK